MPTLTRPRSLTLLAAAGIVGAFTTVSAVPAAQAGMSDRDDGFRQVNLVSDQPGRARITDPNLVNAWGLAFSPTSPLWVSDNGANVSTLYTGATAPGTPPMRVPLVVKIPGGGAPTGVVFNTTSGFGLSTQGKSGPAAFIFAGENGDISAWNSTGDPTRAVLVALQRHAVYKGLTMVTMGSRPFLLAANFHRGRIDVFNHRFHRVRMPWAFRSRTIPRGYAPFNVAMLGGRVYVSYAKQDAMRHDDTAGPGHGFINVFSQRGTFLASLVRRGVLNSPWGLAIAPRGFGDLRGKLLVGNFGNGRIHVVNKHTGRIVGTLRTGSGKPIVIDGLWGLLPGNGTSGGTSDVWFSAGPDGESHGLLGILRSRGRG
ncbi:MAG: TIGR03118 family protein [Nocardioidaceae bacterium]